MNAHGEGRTIPPCSASSQQKTCQQDVQAWTRSQCQRLQVAASRAIRGQARSDACLTAFPCLHLSGRSEGSSSACLEAFAGFAAKKIKKIYTIITHFAPNKPCRPNSQKSQNKCQRRRAVPWLCTRTVATLFVCVPLLQEMIVLLVWVPYAKS